MIAIGVEGMSCDGCVRSLTRALLATEGVTSAEVSLEEKAARVEGSAKREALEAAVRGAGFGVRPAAGSGG